MATTPERESILNNIVEVLQTMKQGDTYNYTPAKVTREPLDYDQIEQYPSYIILDGPESFDYYGKRVINSFLVMIRGFNYGEKGFDSSTKLNKMIKDVKNVLVLDVTRGGYASNTEVLGVESDQGVLAPYIIFEMTLRISYLSIEVYR